VPLDTSLNKDISTWKQYETIVHKRNSSEIWEIKLDLEDVILSGTKDSSVPMITNIPRF
jgi:hypothetical protein